MELRYYLLETRKTQKYLAAKLGLTPHTLNKYVHRETSPPLKIAMMLAYEAKGRIEMHELLSKKDFLEVNKMYRFLKTVPV